MKPIDKRLSAEDKVDDLCNRMNSLIEGQDLPWNISRFIEANMEDYFTSPFKGRDLIKDSIKRAIDDSGSEFMVQATYNAEKINDQYRKFFINKVRYWGPIIINLVFMLCVILFK